MCAIVCASASFNAGLVASTYVFQYCLYWNTLCAVRLCAVNFCARQNINANCDWSVWCINLSANIFVFSWRCMAHNIYMRLAHGLRKHFQKCVEMWVNNNSTRAAFECWDYRMRIIKCRHSVWGLVLSFRLGGRSNYIEAVSKLCTFFVLVCHWNVFDEIPSSMEHWASMTKMEEFLFYIRSV